jgi:hypothetical protein
MAISKKQAKQLQVGDVVWNADIGVPAFPVVVVAPFAQNPGKRPRVWWVRVDQPGPIAGIPRWCGCVNEQNCGRFFLTRAEAEAA